MKFDMKLEDGFLVIFIIVLALGLKVQSSRIDRLETAIVKLEQIIKEKE